MAPAALLLGAALAAAAPGFTVRGAAGPLRVEATLELSTVPPGPPLRLAWRSAGAGLVGLAEDARLAAAVHLEPGPAAGFAGRVELRWKAEREVAQVGLRLRLPGRGRAWGRELGLVPLRGPLRVDLGTPVLVVVPALALVGGPGLAGALVEPAGGATRVLLILDDASAHPFAVYERCLSRLPATPGPRAFAELERKRPLARIRRRPGERQEAVFQLLPLGGGEARPLRVERWPSGARAALVFTDHADRTDPEALRAVLFGASAPTAPGYGSRGLIPRGLRITKSFFARDRRGGLLDDPEAARLAEELRAAGSEVALHSPGTGPDDRGAVQEALAALAPWRMATWIDHQPYTNCEAISSAGWEAGGRYGIRDLLIGAGFRWLWEANDLAGFGRPRLVNLLTAARPGDAAPPVYPLPADPRLWVFQSSFFHGSAAALGAALSDEALARLEAANGLFVGHTYLSASRRTTHDPAHLARLAVREAGWGGLEIAPELDAGLARAGARVRAGALSALTLAEAADRLRALSELEVRYLPGGEVRLENRGADRLGGLTLSVDGAALELAGAGPGAAARPLALDRMALDLGPGEGATLRARGATGLVPFLPADPAATLAP